jgi:hypothetical protein
MEFDPYDDSKYEYRSRTGLLRRSIVKVEYREDYLLDYDLGDVLSQPQHWISVYFEGKEHRYNWKDEVFRREDRNPDYIYDLELKVCEILGIPLRKRAPLTLTICHYRNARGYIFWAYNEYVSFKIQRRPKGKKYTIKPAFCDAVIVEKNQAIHLSPKLKEYQELLPTYISMIDAYIALYADKLISIIKINEGYIFFAHRDTRRFKFESIVSLPAKKLPNEV